jgi:hypothetical protein
MDSDRQFRAQPTALRGLIGHAPDRGKMKVDRGSREGRALKERAISHHDGPVKADARFGAIPGNELLDGMFVAPTGMCRRQRIEYCRLRVFQLRDCKAGATAIGLRCLFLEWHGKRLLPPPPNAAGKQISVQN